MIMYKLLPFNPIVSNVQIVVRLSDNANIPFYTDNTDYQAYLKWVEEGNEPLPAETV